MESWEAVPSTEEAGGSDREAPPRGPDAATALLPLPAPQPCSSPREWLTSHHDMKAQHRPLFSRGACFHNLTCDGRFSSLLGTARARPPAAPVCPLRTPPALQLPARPLSRAVSATETNLHARVLGRCAQSQPAHCRGGHDLCI